MKGLNMQNFFNYLEEDHQSLKNLSPSVLNRRLQLVEIITEWATRNPKPVLLGSIDFSLFDLQDTLEVLDELFYYTNDEELETYGLNDEEIGEAESANEKNIWYLLHGNYALTHTIAELKPEKKKRSKLI